MSVAPGEPVEVLVGCLDRVRGMLAGLNDEGIVQALREVETYLRQTQSVMLDVVAEAACRRIVGQGGIRRCHHSRRGLPRTAVKEDIREEPREQGTQLVKVPVELPEGPFCLG
jgi:hypothetical protein